MIMALRFLIQGEAMSPAAKKSKLMNKSLDAVSIKDLKKVIKKIRSKSHCKLSRNEQVVIVLHEVVNVFSKERKPSRKKSRSWLPGTLKFIAKLLKKLVVVKLFDL